MNPSPDAGSITKLLAQFGDMEEEAAEVLWHRYFERICNFASQRIFPRHRRLFDEEDIANAAMFALVEGLRKGNFNRVKNRDELWQLLVVITARKVSNAGIKVDRLKRGGGKVRGESAFRINDIENVQGLIAGEGRQIDFANFEVTCNELLEQLPNAEYREIALMRLAGYSNTEIAERLGCTRRTVERKLIAIQMLWLEIQSDD